MYFEGSSPRNGNAVSPSAVKCRGGSVKEDR